MSTTQLPDDRLQFGEVAEDRIRFEVLDPLGPFFWFVYGAIQVAPELVPPLLHQIGADKAGQDQVAIGLERVNLVGTEHAI